MKYVGWFLLTIGTMAAFGEPHGNIGCVAIAGAVLIAADRLSAAVARPSQQRQ